MGDKLRKMSALIYNSTRELQCCHGNFSYSAKMMSYERKFLPMILIGKISVYKHCFCYSHLPTTEQKTFCFDSHKASGWHINDNG